MITIIADKRTVIPLGRQGENNAVHVKFSVSGWAELYGAGAFELLNQRPSENTPYTCSITVDDEFVNWIVQAADVAVAGHGECELTYVVGGTVAKSVRFATDVQRSIEGSGTVPPAYESRIADLIEASTDVSINAGRAEAAADAAAEAAAHYPYIDSTTGNWFAWDPEASLFYDTGVHASGEGGGGGGTSTIAWKPTVDAQGNISWTRTSSETAPATRNIKGPQGERGLQGPAGADGEQGPAGPQGPAYTLTDADKEQIVQAVIDDLPLYDGSVI